RDLRRGARHMAKALLAEAAMDEEGGPAAVGELAAREVLRERALDGDVVDEALHDRVVAGTAELGAPVLERVLRAHGVGEDPPQEVPALEPVGRPQRRVAGELAREAELVDVPVAGEQDHPVLIAALGAREARDGAATVWAAIDRVAAEHEGCAVGEDQVV